MMSGFVLRGLYFCLADDESGFPLLIMLVGDVPLEKADKYLAFAQEKARRLGEHPEHHRSYESRNPEANQWGGAIRTAGLRFSISGLPELGDEAACLVIAENFMPSLPSPVAIGKDSQNPYWERLRRWVHMRD